MRFITGVLVALMSAVMVFVILANLPAPPSSSAPDGPALVVETPPEPVVEEVAVFEDVVETPSAPEVEEVTPPEVTVEETPVAEEVAEAEPIIEEPAEEEQAEPVEEVVPEPEATEVVEAETTPRLPTIGGNQGSSNLIDRRRGTDGAEEGIEPELPNLTTPFVQFATEAEASILPQIGILLEPEGPLDFELSEISLPVSILVSGTDEAAKALYSDARDNGLEVFLTLRPEDPLSFNSSIGAGVSLQAAFQELPEAIGYAQDPILEVDRSTQNAAMQALAELGRGYLEFSSGLISGTLGSNSQLIPSGIIDLGVTGDVNATSIARALDRASLLAAQAGTAILILPLQRQSIEALEAFEQSQKGNTTALMPVSRIINP